MCRNLRARILQGQPPKLLAFSHSYLFFGPQENQDDYFAFESFGRNSTASIFCVMDGHGVAGRQASSFIRSNMSDFLARDDRLDVDPKGTLRHAFVKMQRDLVVCLSSILFSFHFTHSSLQNSKVDCTCSGATCVVAYMNGNKIIVANAGDSRCVLGRLEGSGVS